MKTDKDDDSKEEKEEKEVKEVKPKKRVRKKVYKEKCVGRIRGKDKEIKQCINSPINDTQFCKKHQYMLEFTDEMLQNLKVCCMPSCCKNFY